MKKSRHDRIAVVPETETTALAGADFLQRHFDILLYSGVLIAAVWALGPMLNNHLYNDDFLWIRAAGQDMTWGNVLGFRVIGFFRPLVNVSYFLTEKFAPGNLTLYNSTQIFLHVVNTVLLYHLFRRLLRDRTVAAATAFYFLVTFNHLGAVIWISGRTTLIASMFLLSSLLVTTYRSTRGRRMAAWIFFGLALASKEEAIVGLMLLILVQWYLHRETAEQAQPIGASRFDRTMLFGFLGISITYLLIRTMSLGHFTQSNWSPGIHGLGNQAGSILGQFWPALPMSLLGQSVLPRPGANPLWPEILAIPIVLAFMVAGLAIGRFRAMLFAFLWLLACQLPTVFLKFRFLDMQSVMHLRYYYLPCMGACLAQVLIVVALWRFKRFPRAARVVAAIIFFSVCINDTLRTHNFEKRFSHGNTGMYVLVRDIVATMDSHPELQTLVVEETPYNIRYLSEAIHIKRPDFAILESNGGVEEAVQHRPCIYLARSTENKQEFALYLLE